jgi:hypothetical protein
MARITVDCKDVEGIVAPIERYIDVVGNNDSIATLECVLKDMNDINMQAYKNDPDGEHTYYMYDIAVILD